MLKAGNTVATEPKPRDQMMQLIAVKLGIIQPTAGMPPSEFWAQVALQLNVPAPANNAVEALKQVLDQLDEPWDSDYVEEDGSVPSEFGYEAVYTALNKTPEVVEERVAPPLPEEGGEDEGIEDLAIEGEVKSEPMPLGIETIVSRIEKGTIELDPEWQRRYVWPPKKQRRLIESILLGLPIPSLLLFRDESTGRMYVIDGKQRLETIANFCAKKGHPTRKRFKTFPKTTEGWGAGQPLHDAAGKYYENLPAKYKTKIDDCVLALHVFKELPPEKLYQIFSRYNTGAVQLKAVEIRNAVFQLSALHKMMWRVAGEHGDDALYADDEEREVSQLLRSIMRRKVDRYGAYDFVGRYFGFAYRSTGSVAKATYEFMKEHAKDSPDKVEAFRKEFLRVVQTTANWYDPYPFVKPRPEGEFHQFLATIQLVATKHALDNIAKGRASEEVIRSHIKAHWPKFAEDTLRIKQNSTNFWDRQKEWIRSLESGEAPTEPKELLKPDAAAPAT